jgi:hypothetical protein
MIGELPGDGRLAAIASNSEQNVVHDPRCDPWWR